MISPTNHNSPSLGASVGRIARIALGGIQTRAELLAVELQEERLRLADLLMGVMALMLLSTLGILLLTATIIFLVPVEARIYVTGGFAILYLLGAVAVWLTLRASLSREPFAESVDQVKKDRLWLESLK